MRVFNVKVPIHQIQGREPLGIADFLNTLDDMLDEYGVEHAFALPSKEEQQADNHERELLYWLQYDSDKNIELTLILGLWARVTLRKTREDILHAVVRSLTNPEYFND